MTILILENDVGDRVEVDAARVARVARLEAAGYRRIGTRGEPAADDAEKPDGARKRRGAKSQAISGGKENDD